MQAQDSSQSPDPLSSLSFSQDAKAENDDFILPVSDDYQEDDSPIITCPHCWQEFHLSQTNYISSHASLIGDSVLGEAAQTRFLPTKFNVQGYAIDAKGMVCRDMACPRCHLKIPEIAIEETLDPVSIVGAPASGKSYFVTALASMLRRNLPDYFGYSFTDADVSMNNTLNHYEDLLFHNASDVEVALPKTELEGNGFSSQVTLRGMTISLPLPYIFTIRKVRDNVPGPDGREFMHNLVLYDNAGEHFEAGRDSVTNLATMHLIKSSLIMFLFDPFKDSKALRDCDKHDPQANVAQRTINQGNILREMINRIRKFRGMGAYEKSDKMMVVLVPKYDAWADTFPFELSTLPYTYFSQNSLEYSLDMTIVKLVSYAMRQWLQARAPDIVADCESFFETVYFLPASALGTCPSYDAQRNMVGVNPSKINPIWVDVPMYLYLWKCGFIPAVKSSLAVDAVEMQGSFKDDCFVFMHGQRPCFVPDLYCGSCVYDMNLGSYIQIPERPADLPKTQPAAAKAEKDDFWN